MNNTIWELSSLTVYYLIDKSSCPVLAVYLSTTHLFIDCHYANLSPQYSNLQNLFFCTHVNTSQFMHWWSGSPLLVTVNPNQWRYHHRDGMLLLLLVLSIISMLKFMLSFFIVRGISPSVSEIIYICFMWSTFEFFDELFIVERCAWFIFSKLYHEPYPNREFY